VTKAHDDRIKKDGKDKGYSIRVGKNLPINSANLAYVSTPEMGPTKNLQLNDLSVNIKENGLASSYDKEKMMYPSEDFMLRELTGESKLPSRRITISDEFSVPATTQEQPVPLYYRALAKHRFDAKGALVSPFLAGYTESPPERIVDYAQMTGNQKENLLYLGNKIRITNLDGTAINSEYKYKIHLVAEEGAGLPQNAYRIYIYTNFRGNANETFMLRYEKYNEDGSHEAEYEEILNAYPFFEEVDKYYLDEISENPKLGGEWRPELNDKSFTVVETDDNAYEVYAPAQVLVANNVTRPSHQFKYRVRGDLKTRLTNANPGEIKIGVAFLNTSIINVEDLTGTLKKLYEDDARPPYLDFLNPVPPQKSFLKENPRYWIADLSMPAEEWNEYDLVIITGYGYYDMRPYNDAIRNYLANGGKIWIDNAGETGKALTFKAETGEETFLTSVGFSNTSTKTGMKAPAANETAQELLNRLYVLGGSSQLAIGYNNGKTQVNPAITFGSGESINNWTTIVRYADNSPSIMQRNMFGKGTVMVSNCGLFRSLFYSNPTELRFIMNTVLCFAERKWIQGPWKHEYVYHRDNLFREEYQGAGGTTVYVDERNDFDASQIVAKKIINRTTRGALLPHLPPSYFSAKGTYEAEVESNTEIPISNGSMEVGTYDNTARKAVTEWTTDTAEAIPGWNTKRLAGASAKFTHLDSSSQRGAKALQLEAPTGATGSHAYWANVTTPLVAGSYQASMWMKTKDVAAITASGATVGVYDMTGTLIAKGSPLLGTRDWIEVKVNFSLSSAKEVEIRGGFVDGNGTGTIAIDYLTLHSIGSVYMTPSNDGATSLYAYAVRPRGETFDLRAQGFSTADITTYDPEIAVTYTIRAFVYAWDNYAGRYMRLYGNSVTETRNIRRSDGVVSFGSMSTMLPALNAGADWADRNDVYYEVYLGSNDGISTDSQFVDMEIYDAKSGKYYYNKDGEVIIKYMDLFYTGENKNILLQARTNYYTIRATKRRYGVMVEAENKIQLAYPSTIDNRDCWFLRVENGSFIKKELNYNDIKDLLAYDSRYYEFQQRLFGTHYYSLPEYNRQVFKPSIGIKRVRQELAEYINDNTIRVQNAPLYVQEGEAEKELLAKADSEGLVYEGLYGEWDRESLVRVYVDEDMNGNEVEWIDGFDIDYTNGMVIFEEPINGTVKADYKHGNLEVWRRTYNNVRVRNKVITSTDKKTYISPNKNWLQFPAPVVKVVPFNSNEEEIVPVTSYRVDYENGAVMFNEDMYDRVKVDYTYSTDKQLKIRDYDAQNGYIYLEEPVDFKNELYVNYYYEEDYLEYRGFYDETVGEFIHLDLNPSEGHYSTMPVVRTDSFTGITFTSWELVPTAKLMNKEIYVYLLPYKDSFGNYEQHTVRHTYSLKEWQIVQKTNPAAMLLGILQLREHTNIHEAIVMDARSRGGGLKESIKDSEIKKRQPLSQNYWDMSTWDGTAYYKNGVLIIQVPKRVLQINGGQFTEEAVQKIVKQHIAYGIYFIVEYV